ncbi:MAG: radical SAM/SPASM domain-containing protein [Planctomycetes bacterium]|jgi:radical SAM protein with 4Fe4S-binding SPASM domain|nr:radical SAM/SPASM domain-containing protein [Planctomycetota bacterium]MDP6410537.1 radical SAM protein [Planctomycetota bacterium]
MRLLKLSPSGPATDTAAADLTWIDVFIENVRPFVFVREEDNVLIKRPNQAQKLNDQGVAILKPLLEGKRIAELLDEIGRHPRQIQDIHLFLCEIKRFLEGTLTEVNATSAVQVEPFDMHFSELPILSEVAITYRCNLRCSFCYAGCNCTTNPVGSDREMSVAEIRTVLDRIYLDAKVPSVSFTGGEATLRGELPELIAYAKELGMRVNLITNGTMVTEGLATRLADAGLDSAQVSLEGVTAAVHERVTMIPHSFEKTLAAVEHLDAAGVLTHTNTTINKDNLAECPRMPRFVKDELNRTKFSMNLIVPTGSAALNDRLVVKYRDLGPYLEAIAEESKRHEVEFMWYSPTPMCMFNPVIHGLGNKGCSACDGLISIGANGDVIPCASYDESVGNILEEGVDRIWKGRRATEFREKFLAHPQCRDCENFHICNGACPLYWRHMGFGELEEHNGFAPADEEHFER